MVSLEQYPFLLAQTCSASLKHLSLWSKFLLIENTSRAFGLLEEFPGRVLLQFVCSF